MASSRGKRGERLFNTRIEKRQTLLGLKDVIDLEQKGFAKRSIMPPLGEGKPFDGGLLDRLNSELNIKINSSIFFMLGLTTASDSKLVEMNDRSYKSAPLIFLFNNKGSSRTVKVDRTDTTFIINREPGRNQELIAKSIRVGGVIRDLTGKDRTVGVRYELPHPNWESKLKPGTALTVDFSISRKEAERLDVEPEMLQRCSPATNLEKPHNTAGLITKKMTASAEEPQYFIRLSIDNREGKFVLDKSLNKGLEITSRNGTLIITLLGKEILKIPENALIE